MSMFAKRIAEAKPGDHKGVLFEPGVYPIAQCTKVKIFPSKKPGREGAEMMAIEFDLLESKVASRPAGMTNVSQVINGQHIGSAADGLNFLVAIFPNVDPNDWNWKPGIPDEEQAINQVTSAIQPARGRLVALEVYHKKSSKTGNVFTVHKYTAVSEETQARAAELRAAAGLPPL